MTIESNIKRIISQKGFVQKHIAERSGFDQKTFSNMLCGRGVLKAEYIPKIASALGVTPNELYGIDDQSQKSA